VEREKGIAEALARGDTRAAADIAIRGYEKEIRAYLGRLLGSADDAADAFSFWEEDVWKGIASFEGRGSARVWVYRVASRAGARVAREAWRRRRVRMRTTAASHLAATARSSGAASRDRQAAALDKLREILSYKDRELLVLRLDKRLRFREIAAVLAREGKPADDLAVAAVRKRFERLKTRLGDLARDKGLLK
jgi:RNA polymerase sigma factor (sigma-70 family)